MSEHTYHDDPDAPACAAGNAVEEIKRLRAEVERLRGLTICGCDGQCEHVGQAEAAEAREKMSQAELGVQQRNVKALEAELSAAEHDIARYKAIIDGSWPSADEVIRQARKALEEKRQKSQKGERHG